MRSAFVALTTGVLIALGGCSRSAEVKYKLSVELEEEGSARSGSSIWSRKIRRPTVALASPYDNQFRGEAVRIPLANHPTVYALLVNPEGEEGYALMLVERTFGAGFREFRRSGKSYDRVQEIRDIAGRVGERAELDCRDYRVCPMLVWFEREDDPTSIQTADPAQLPTIRDGVSVRRIEVEVTDEVPSYAIAKALPWLEAVGRDRSSLISHPTFRPGDGKTKPKRTPLQKVGTRHFTTELYR